MDYRYLDAFMAAGKHLNFTAAARELNITTAALSRQIKLLEQSLEKQLFIRSPQQVKLTENGHKLFKVSNRFKVETDSLFKSVEHKEIRIGTITPIMNGVLTKFLSKYYKNNLQVSFNIVTGPPSKIVRMMEAGELDLGLCNKNIQTDLLTSKKWLTEKPQLISKKKIDLREVNQERWVLVEKKDYLINYAFKRRIQRSKLLTYVDSPPAQLELVKEGFGVAIVSNWMVKGEKGIHVQDIKEFKEENFYIIQPNSMYMDHHISEFIEKISTLSNS